MSSVSLNHEERRKFRFSDLESFALFMLTLVAMFGVMIANQTHIETNDQVKLAGGLEILTRLSTSGLAGLIGLYGFLFIPRVRHAFLSFPGFWVLGIFVCFIVGTFCSPYFRYSFPHLVTFTCVVLFSPTAFAILGSRRMVSISIGTLTVTLLASWFLFLAMPEYGVVIEVTSAAGDSVERMGGTSHPNVLAGTSVLLIVLTCYMWFEQKMGTFLAVPLIVLCVVTLIYTGTRVAAVSAILSILIVYRGFWQNPEVWPFTVVGVGAALLVAMFVLSDESGSLVSTEAITRSGDIDEITSVTGRAEIWEFIVEKIGERPLTGWGPGTAKIVLDKRQMLLHTHNVVLSMAFVGGVLCGVFAVLMFLHQLLVSIQGKYKLAALISFVIILNSFTENPIFDYIPGAPTVLWLVAVFWPVLDDGTL